MKILKLFQSVFSLAFLPKVEVIFSFLPFKICVSHIFTCGVFLCVCVFQGEGKPHIALSLLMLQPMSKWFPCAYEFFLGVQKANASGLHF